VRDNAVKIVIERGRTVPFAALPPRSVALDGYVQGPFFDAARERYSFDHHAGCMRHATLSTCEMVLDALRVGFDPDGMTAYVNDLDPDSVLALWLLLRPTAAADDAVADAIRPAGRLDALGPAIGGPGLVPALTWALMPLLGAMRDTAATRRLDADGLRALLDVCVARLAHWRAAGAPTSTPDMAPPPPPAGDLEVLHRGDAWQLVRSGGGISAFAAVYRSGARGVIVAHELPDGTTEYSVGKASEFVHGFDVPAILAALRAEEARVNPAQDPAHSWGGGTTIGGSPRNADGSASRLPWARVAAIVERARGGGAG
jgi:hypothetical protein